MSVDDWRIVTLRLPDGGSVSIGMSRGGLLRVRGAEFSSVEGQLDYGEGMTVQLVEDRHYRELPEAYKPTDILVSCARDKEPDRLPTERRIRFRKKE